MNTLSWTCHESQFTNFTVLYVSHSYLRPHGPCADSGLYSVGNTNPSILSQPQAIIAIENNFDCSKTITQEQEIFPAGSGYTILLANTLNNTDVLLSCYPQTRRQRS